LKASPKYKALSNFLSHLNLEEELTPIPALFLTVGLCPSDVEHIHAEETLMQMAELRQG
jgi:hypothetical protein